MNALMCLPPEPPAEVWYRVMDRMQLPELWEPLADPFMETFKVTKHTKCGVWLETWKGPKFVNKSSHKQFACPTREAAIDSFRRRKLVQLRILTSQIENCKAQIFAINDQTHVERLLK